jgi:hypothetical protein
LAQGPEEKFGLFGLVVGLYIIDFVKKLGVTKFSYAKNKKYLSCYF